MREQGEVRVSRSVQEHVLLVRRATRGRACLASVTSESRAAAHPRAGASPESRVEVEQAARCRRQGPVCECPDSRRSSRCRRLFSIVVSFIVYEAYFIPSRSCRLGRWRDSHFEIAAGCPVRRGCYFTNTTQHEDCSLAVRTRNVETRVVAVTTNTYKTKQMCAQNICYFGNNIAQGKMIIYCASRRNLWGISAVSIHNICHPCRMYCAWNQIL